MYQEETPGAAYPIFLVSFFGSRLAPYPCYPARSAHFHDPALEIRTLKHKRRDWTLDSSARTVLTIL